MVIVVFGNALYAQKDAIPTLQKIHLPSVNYWYTVLPSQTQRLEVPIGQDMDKYLEFHVKMLGTQSENITVYNATNKAMRPIRIERKGNDITYIFKDLGKGNYYLNKGESSHVTKISLQDITPPTSSIQKFNMAQLNFHVYPNPAKEQVNIVLPEEFRSAFAQPVIEIYDLKGQLMKSQVAQEQNISINTTDLAKGLYFAHISLGEENSIKEKIMIVE